MRISPVASLRGVRHRLHRAPAQHAAHAGAVLLRDRPAVPRDRGSTTPRRAIIGLTVYTSPFVAEALRSGINGVPVGQAEAARSVGLGFGQTVGLIVLPQAFRMTIPPLINVFIALTKNTSVAGGFFVIELFASTRELANANGNAVIAILLAVGDLLPAHHGPARPARGPTRAPMGGAAMSNHRPLRRARARRRGGARSSRRSSPAS